MKLLLFPYPFRLKSFWDRDQSVAHFMPQPFHCAGSPDIVYGGLLVSLMDCHACNFAMARHYLLEQREIGSDPKIFCVTAQLNISLSKPTPMGHQLEIRAALKSEEGRKTWVSTQVIVDNEVRASGDILVVRLKQND